MFKLRCENCGYEDNIDKFFDSVDGIFNFEIKIITITFECPICGMHHHIESNRSKR